jgi:hypothetical protein
MTASDAPATVAATDPIAVLGVDEQAAFAAVADLLIPAAHGMPSAGEVVDDARLRFVLEARPDLAEALRAALRPELGNDAASRLAILERDEPANLAALQLAVVGGYYTDRRVRELIGYPGQMAKQVYAWKVPEYVDEGLIEATIARGAVWRDPATGRRAEVDPDAYRSAIGGSDSGAGSARPHPEPER